MSFKLLAIRPLKGCSKDVLKNLKEEEFYFFDNAYAQYKNTDYIRKKESGSGLSNDFFFQKDTESSLEYVNVQAIVGMNGSGKSSIVEFLMRMLNNVFWLSSKKTNKNLDLLRAKGIKGSLFFLYQGKINVITLQNKINPVFIDWQMYEENIVHRKISFPQQKKTGCIMNRKRFKELHNIFFTMYINYSLYGLDELDFKNEGNDKDEEGNEISWLSKIFHKNDGYQTPLVIHPYREDAMIDVRKEKYLMNQRLASLLFTNDKYRDTISGYSVDKISLNKRENQISMIISRIFSINVYSDENNKTLRKGHHSFSFERYESIDKLVRLKSSRTISYIDMLYDYVLKNEFFFNFIKTNYIDIEDQRLTSEMPELEAYIYFIFLTLSSPEVQHKVINANEEIRSEDITVPKEGKYKDFSSYTLFK